MDININYKPTQSLFIKYFFMIFLTMFSYSDLSQWDSFSLMEKILMPIFLLIMFSWATFVMAGLKIENNKLYLKTLVRWKLMDLNNVKSVHERRTFVEIVMKGGILSRFYYIPLLSGAIHCRSNLDNIIDFNRRKHNQSVPSVD